jgi:NADH:ubiquinone oxidoreductase subunit H
MADASAESEVQSALELWVGGYRLINAVGGWQLTGLVMLTFVVVSGAVAIAAVVIVLINVNGRWRGDCINHRGWRGLFPLLQ